MSRLKAILICVFAYCTMLCYGEISPLTMPLIYLPEEPLHFQIPDFRYNEPTIQDSLQWQLTEVNEFTLRRNARRYITTHCAGVYRGVLDTVLLEAVHYYVIEVPEVAVKVPKSMVQDVEGERLERLYREKMKASKWYYGANTMLQLTQNFVTRNWYAGGNSNFALLGIAEGYAKYDNKKNITWENKGEWRMGFNTVQGDTLRKVNTNEDLFKLYSKLGVKIVKKLNYSVSAELQTHFFNTWKDNTKDLKTGPLTPVRFNFATGVDYRPINNLSIYFAPLTYKMVYAADTIYSDQNNYSIPQGKKIINELGSSVRVDWHWQPLQEIILNSAFYLYTNYRRVEIDWEITTDFIINRYISARLMLHPRFDNTVILDTDQKAHLQFKELISLGFAHKFR